MKKLALVALLVFLLTIGFGVYYLLTNLDSIVKMAIETYGSHAIHTAVQVNQVRINLKDGSGSIHGLTVANPDGFQTKQAFSLGTIATQLDLQSLSKDLLAVEQITVNRPEVYYELNEAGENNLSILRRNLSGKASEDSRTSLSKPSGETGPKLIIRILEFSAGRIHAFVAPANKTYELKLPDFTLQNLGGPGGSNPAQIAKQLLDAISERILREVQRQGIDQYKRQFQDEVDHQLEETQQKIGDEANNKLKQLLNN